MKVVELRLVIDDDVSERSISAWIASHTKVQGVIVLEHDGHGHLYAPRNSEWSTTAPGELHGDIQHSLLTGLDQPGRPR